MSDSEGNSDVEGYVDAVTWWIPRPVERSLVSVWRRIRSRKRASRARGSAAHIQAISGSLNGRQRLPPSLCSPIP